MLGLIVPIELEREILICISFLLKDKLQVKCDKKPSEGKKRQK